MHAHIHTHTHKQTHKHTTTPYYKPCHSFPHSFNVPEVLSIIHLSPSSLAQAFHDVAYQAESRDELLQAINHFLDDSIVLPPGDWDQKTLLPIMDMARKRAQIRRRNKQKEKAGNANG